MEHFECPDCGPHVAADENGCCSTCGRDTIVAKCDCLSGRDKTTIDCDQCKAGVQLRALDTIFFMGHMSQAQALRELGLIEEQYAQLAEAEGLPRLALEIRELMQT